MGCKIEVYATLQIAITSVLIFRHILLLHRIKIGFKIRKLANAKLENVIEIFKINFVEAMSYQLIVYNYLNL